MTLTFNTIRSYAKHAQQWLQAQVKLAMIEKPNDTIYLNYLFAAYVVCFTTLFFTQKDPANWNYNPAQTLYNYLLMPLVFIPLEFEAIPIWKISVPLPTKLSLYNPFRNFLLCFNPFFFVTLVCLLNHATLSYFLPTKHQLYFQIYFCYFLPPLISFFIVTVRLSVDYPKFYYRFYFFIGPIVAINAVINIFLFLNSFEYLNYGFSARISASYGFALGNNPNLDSIVYCSFFIGLFATAITKSSKYRNYISIIALIILGTIIILEQSRGPLIGLAVALIALIIINFKRLTWQKLWPFLLGLTVGIVFIHSFVPGGLHSYIERADAFRFELWRRAIDITREAPFFGYGDRDIFAINISNGVHKHSHNILLGAQLRGGMLGFATMVLILIIGLLQTFRYAKATNNPVPLCVFLVFLISGLFDFELKLYQADWEWVAFWITIAFSLGADANLRQSEMSKHPDNPQRGLAMLLSLKGRPP